MRALALALGLSLFSSPAVAQLENWYVCTHPEWRAELGFSDLMVPASAIEQFGQGPGVTCSLLDVDYTSSKGRACYLAWQHPQNVWYEWTGGTPTVVPLFCP